MPDIQEQKQQIRRQALQLRNSLDTETYLAGSLKIEQRLLELDEVKSAKVVHIYSAMENRFEVRTAGLIQHFLDTGKTVVVPVMEFGTGRTLKHTKVGPDTKWHTNKWGVKEPEKGEEVDPAEIDLVILPVVAADEKRNRIGYGKGYYDTFLEETDAFRAGLVFEINIVKSVPAETHDKVLDVLITEKRIIGR